MSARKSRLLAVFLVVLLGGCAAVRPSAPGTPTRPATPYENILAWNAALANANLAIAQGVIAANDANEISVPMANLILTAQSKIADADRQLTLILQKGQQAAAGDSASVKALLTQIQQSAQDMIRSGTAGIKNPARAEAIRASVGSVITLASQMYNTFANLGIIER